VETTEAALQDGSDSLLPPLMNPTMLEASEDLTSLSHLNEPAGEPRNITHLEVVTDPLSSPAGHQITILTERNLHIFGNSPDSYESVRASGFVICTSDGSSVCREAASVAGATFVRHC
jgi:hypothetical protein